MERKQAKDLQVGDECYLVSPYCKSKILKVTEVLRTIDGNKYKVRFNDGSFCIIYYNVSCMAWAVLDTERGMELFELDTTYSGELFLWMRFMHYDSFFGFYNDYKVAKC